MKTASVGTATGSSAVLAEGIAIDKNAIEWDREWLSAQRTKALVGLAQANFRGHMELSFKTSASANIPDARVLRSCAKSAAIHTFGWPIGIVLDKEDGKPRPISDGIFAEVRMADTSYDRWALRPDGSFYLLRSLFEDEELRHGSKKKLFFDTRIVQVTEAFLYCHRLLTELDIPQTSLVRVAITHGGLEGRVLKAASAQRLLGPFEQTSIEDSIRTEVVEVKDSQKRYLFAGRDAQDPFWGLSQIVTTSMGSGNFMVGSGSPVACELRDRTGMMLEISTQHSDFFASNKIMFRAERRLALITYRPGSFIFGTFASSPA